MIAISKLEKYARQEEFRLVFSVTNAFDFQNGATRLVQDVHRDAANPAEHHHFPVATSGFRDICRLHPSV